MINSSLHSTGQNSCAMGDKFNKECLERHNHWRQKHGCPPLKLNAQLIQSAQKWADKLGSTGALQHSPESKGKMGENVAMKWVQGGGEFSGELAKAGPREVTELKVLASLDPVFKLC